MRSGEGAAGQKGCGLPRIAGVSSTISRRTDVVVVGAGAAGLMTALEAGRRGKKVVLLDHGERPGRKILISGGGRCNFTNVHARAENFLSENLHFARSALARFTPA
ncbi:MAG TPA: FAD-dependent oxidoreductase, partial [Acidobacteriaceae bacterium]|nr:FAD-dependent oxidoreductase [Acidobacteriaceae bacterium]